MLDGIVQEGNRKDALNVGSRSNNTFILIPLLNKKYKSDSKVDTSPN
jgi:hypothetical protein